MSIAQRPRDILTEIAEIKRAIQQLEALALLPEVAGSEAVGGGVGTPDPHAASHEDGGSDEVTLAQSQITGLLADLAALASDADLATHAAQTTGVHGLDAKAPLASPGLTGTPTVPTAAGGTNTTQAASTAFVKNAIDGVIAGAPGALDTLDELAAALGDDANAIATLTTLIGTKLAKASNLSDLTNAGTARTNLGLGALATLSTITASLVTDFNTAVRTNRLDQMAAPTASVSLNSQRATNASAPSAGSDLSTKSYVDLRIAGLNLRADVKAVLSLGDFTSTPTFNSGAGTITGASNGGFPFTGGGTVSGGLAPYDGLTVNPAVGDRILVLGAGVTGSQTAHAAAGIYEITTVGSAGTAFVLTRTSDANESSEFIEGMAARRSFDGLLYKISATFPVTLNTDALLFAAFTNPPTVDGVTLELTTTGTARVKDNGITNAKMADNAITSAEIGDCGFGTYFSTPTTGQGASVAVTANRVYYCAVIIPHQCTLTGIWISSSASGNVRSALYDSTGARVANRSTDQALAAGLNKINFTATYAAEPGLYYMATVFSATPATLLDVPAARSDFVAGPGATATATSITPPDVTLKFVPVMGTY